MVRKKLSYAVGKCHMVSLSIIATSKQYLIVIPFLLSKEPNIRIITIFRVFPYTLHQNYVAYLTSVTTATYACSDLHI